MDNDIVEEANAYRQLVMSGPWMPFALFCSRARRAAQQFFGPSDKHRAVAGAAGWKLLDLFGSRHAEAFYVSSRTRCNCLWKRRTSVYHETIANATAISSQRAS